MQSQNPEQLCSSVLRMLIDMRKLLNHPAMLLSDKSQRFHKLLNKKNLKNIKNSGKFTALQQILIDLGFQSNDDNTQENALAITL